DNYLTEIVHDISRIQFIATMNDDRHLDAALRDRLNIIDVPSYNKQEQIEIMMKHSLPEACEKCGLRSDDVSIDGPAAHQLLLQMAKDIKSSGMRAVEKVVYDMVSKLSFLRLGESDFNLSYKVTDFQGFPYVINKKT